MAEVRIKVDGQELVVAHGTTVAAALLNARIPSRRSVLGETRTALCGMGICFECRVTIDGRPLQRGCMIDCEDGMEVRTRDA